MKNGELSGVIDPLGEVRCPFSPQRKNMFFTQNKGKKKKHQVHLGQMLSQPLYHPSLRSFVDCKTLTRLFG